MKAQPPRAPAAIQINVWLLAASFALAALLLVATLQRIEVDTDITKALPASDPVINDAKQLLATLPNAGQVVIDLELQPQDPQQLLIYGNLVAQRLEASGRFERVGISEYRKIYPPLIERVVRHLPYLFGRQQLETALAPRLTRESIQSRLQHTLQNFQGLDGLGLATTFPKDPLGWHELVLARLQPLAPAADVVVADRFLLSKDRRHLLIVATPSDSATDTRHGRAIADLTETIEADLNARIPAGVSLELTVMGAFRAALDNESMAKGDTRRAVLFATLGISLLFFISFKRPWLGLLALLPATAGTIAALFTISLYRPQLSLISIGFGGAVIAITVDHAIAFLLFLDRTDEPISGAEAAREVWAVGLIAALTTVGAFFSLTFSGFDLLAQVGQFAALGIGFAFLFVHTFFKRIFRRVYPSTKAGNPLMVTIADHLVLKGQPFKAATALAVTLLMLFWARPTFDIDLKAMNALSAATRQAEARIRDTWGDMGGNTYIRLSAADLPALRAKADKLTPLLADRQLDQTLAQSLSVANLFPGSTLARANLAAWHHFWNADRIQGFKADLAATADALGFAPSAFTAFVALIENPPPCDDNLPPLFFDLLQIRKGTDNTPWTAVVTAKPGPRYDPARFRKSVLDAVDAQLFDPDLFSARLGELIAGTFTRMAGIVAVSAFVLLLVFFRNLVQALIAMLPLAAALACTLGTMGIMGRSLDIPGLMLTIVVMGMGIDYSLYLVRAYQHFDHERDAGSRIVRLTVLLAACSTLMGFGAMAFADHVVLKSAGLTTSGAIFYALVMTFALLPYLQKRYAGHQKERSNPPAGNKTGPGAA